MKCPRCGYTESIPNLLGGIGDFFGLDGNAYGVAFRPHFNAGMSQEEVAQMQCEQMLALANSIRPQEESWAKHLRAMMAGSQNPFGARWEVKREREGSVSFPGPPRTSIVIG